jgi:hypothetical protein
MKKLFSKIFIIKLLLVFIFVSFNLKAITLNNIEVSEQYGRLNSHEESCSIARDRFFDKARRLASGEETISFESTNICKFSEQEENCNLYTNSFRSIAKVQIIEYEFLKFSDGSKCRFSSLGNNIFEATVKGNVVLEKLPAPPDNFNFRTSINANQFVSYPTNKIKQRKKNDDLEIKIETTEDMYVYIFQWWPYEDNNTIQKIFPNNVDTMNFFKSNAKYLIPTSEKLAEYRFRIDFPNDEYVYDNDVQEFLMIIGTKEQVPFFNEYKYTDFGKKLANIKNYRQERMSYIIHKRTD